MTLVEGSVSTPEQRTRSGRSGASPASLITIGACATSGGVQALRNATGKHDEFVRTVYPTPEYMRSLEDSHPISDYVKVDLQLTGCPVDRGQLLGAIASLLQRRHASRLGLAGMRRVQAAGFRLRRRGQG